MIKHVKNRYAIDLRKTNLGFDIYDNDIKENIIRKKHYIEMFNKKIELIKMFQNGIDLWKH